MSERKKKVVVLGSTGSIGQSTLKVARHLSDRMEVLALAAGRSAEKLAEQLSETGARHACLSDADATQDLKGRVNADTCIHSGDEGLIELATLEEADMVIVAIVGVAGLRPALAALEAGKDLAVASKEILVMAGEQVMETARRTGSKVLPIDSEHNAIFQCLEGRSPHEISRLILTASGGPFRELPTEDLPKVMPEDALKHPTWEMGPKITIDSATLFNKGLEMIEARWLFEVEMDRVDVIVHPQSIIHSMVEFNDNSVLAQLSVTDMCFPIQYAITWPERLANPLPPLDLASIATLDFEAPRLEDFPALNLARRAGVTGGSLPAVMNAANEVAVARFLEGGCLFPQIWEHVAAVMDAHKHIIKPDLDDLIAADQWARTIPMQ